MRWLLLSFLFFSHLSSMAAEIEYLAPQDMETRRWELIENSQKEIFAAYFIVEHDRGGKNFLARLMKAALDGKDVRLIVDGIGSGPVSALPRSTYSALLGAGVQIKVYHPKFRNLHKLAKRMHDKLLLGDDEMIIGSGNIWDATFAGWLSDGDLLIKGGPVFSARKHFFKLWEEALEPFMLLKSDPNPYIQKNLRPFPVPRSFETNEISNTIHIEDSQIRYVYENTAEDFLHLIESAKSSVVIVNSYVILTDRLEEALKKLTANHVKVTIFTNRSQSLGAEFPLISKAYNEGIPKLHEMDVDLWEYNGFVQLHEKYAIVDHETSYMGSLNLDPIALENNTENGVIIESKEFADLLNSKALKTQQHSFPVIENGILDQDWIDHPPKCRNCSFYLNAFYPILRGIL